MQTLTSLTLANELNRLAYKRGVFFMPAHESHIRRIAVSNQEVLIHGEYQKTLETQIYMGPSVTVFVMLKPVGVFGFVPIWRGVAEAWFVVDDAARTYPIAMTKYGRKAQDIAKISMGLHRIQITVRNQDNRARHWALCLGFKEECLMRQYGPDGSDYFLMARF